MIQADLTVILPEIVLALYAMAALIGAVYTSKDALGPLLVWSTAGLMAVLAIWIASNGDGTNIAGRLEYGLLVPGLHDAGQQIHIGQVGNIPLFHSPD